MELVQLSEQQMGHVIRAMFDDFEEVKNLPSPLELHVVASNWNWDDGCKVLEWIIRNPICDKGTALLLYWRACPKWFYQYTSRDEIPEWSRSIYDFIKEVEERYLSGFYKQAEIAFDPRDDEGTNWIEEYPNVKVKQEIPDQMKAAIPGITIDRSFAS